MEQIKIKNERIKSKLYWSKKSNALAAKSGEEIIYFKEYPDWLNRDFPNIYYLITYNSEMKLRYVTPYSGVYKARFVKFSARENERPKPKPAHDNFGNEVAWFSAVCRLTDRKFNGCNFSIRMDYEKIINKDGSAVIAGTSKPANLLTGFLEATEIFYKDWEYSDNLLPTWQKYIKKKKPEFNVLFERGWTAKVFPIDVFDEDDEEVEDIWEEEEEVDEMDAFDD